jgi:sugar O-acyltransferase (sialic acid O-acetyltransferase NeuD family)
MKTDVIIIGAGGHAKVLIDCLSHQPQINILGILDANAANVGNELLGIKILGTDDEIKHYAPANVQLVNAVGSINLPIARKKVYDHFKALGYTFLTVIHPTAYLAKSCVLGEGCQIMAGSILQPDCVIGNNVIVNTGTSIDHDCQLGDHTHIAPGTVLSGTVRVEAESHIGSRSVILQNLTVGKHSLVGAGSVVIHNLAAGSRVAGVPAKMIATFKEDLSGEELA